MLKHDISLSLLLFDIKTGNNAGISLFPIQAVSLKIIFHFMAGRTLGSFELCLLFHVPLEIPLHPPLWAAGTVLIACILLYLLNCTDAEC